jgi:hypothetical protein
MLKNQQYIQSASTVLYVCEDTPEQIAAAQAATVAAATAAATVVHEAALSKAVTDAIAAESAKWSGLKAKNGELIAEAKKHRDALEAFNGIDPVKAKEMLDAMDQDEDMKLFSVGKKSEVITKYTERASKIHEAALKVVNDKMTAELLGASEKLEAATKRLHAYESAVLDNHIRTVTSELHKGAVEDALLHARQVFSLDAKGNAVKLDAEGNLVMGKDGKTAFSPAEWIESQRELKTHWFPVSSSGSGSGHEKSGAGGKGKQMKRSSFEDLGQPERAVFIKGGGTLTD